MHFGILRITANSCSSRTNTYNILHLNCKERSVLFTWLLYMLYPSESDFRLCLFERMPCLIYYFYSTAQHGQSRKFLSCFYFLPRNIGFVSTAALHITFSTQILQEAVKASPPLYLPPFKKVIVICARKSWSIDIYDTSLLGPPALLLPHRPHRSLRCRLHLLCILIIMAHPLTEELILASI